MRVIAYTQISHVSLWDPFPYINKSHVIHTNMPFFSIGPVHSLLVTHMSESFLSLFLGFRSHIIHTNRSCLTMGPSPCLRVTLCNPLRVHPYKYTYIRIHIFIRIYVYTYIHIYVYLYKYFLKFLFSRSSCPYPTSTAQTPEV